ncbi:MAG: hypothetical protein A3K83_02710 [Omnitrophica WOR_2 bacterium RBG_13_44_8b]|nr:MAG: hypothetical protein A3K83_02710 [Omnitrophica WOR_2 bacterium RBG_13_44_8b]
MKFLLTRELGRLAKWLRILGFDTDYYNQDNISTLVIQALRDNRIIITRNSRLPKPTGIGIVLITSEKIKQQVPEVLGLLKLKLDFSRMFTRCIICNRELAAIEKAKVKDKVPEYVFNTQEEFVACAQCKRIYWQGTHWGNVTKTLEEIKL